MSRTSEQALMSRDAFTPSPPHTTQTDVSLLERGRVIDAVSGDGDDRAVTLTTFHYDELLLRRRAREHDLGVVAEQLVYACRRHVSQVAAVYHACLRLSVAHVNSRVYR